MKKKERLLYNFVYLLLCFTSGACYCIFGPTISDLREFSNVNVNKIGSIFAVRTAGDFVGCLLCGPLVDLCEAVQKRKPVIKGKVFQCSWNFLTIHKILGFGSICIILGIGFIPLAPTLLTQLLCGFLTGFGDGFVITVVSICLMKTGGKFGPSLIQAMWFLYSLGMSVNPLFMSLVFKFDLHAQANLLIIFEVTCVLQILGTVGIFVLKSPPVRSRISTDEENTKNGKRQKRQGNEKKRRTVKEFVEALCAPFMCVPWSVAVFHFLFIFFGVCIQLFHTAFDGRTYYGTLVGLTKSRASLIPSLYNLGRIIGTFEVLVIPSTYIVIQDMLMGCAVFAIYIHFPTSLWAIWSCTFLLGLCASSVVASLFAFPEERFGLILSGMETALYFLGGSIGYVSPSITNKAMNVSDREMYIKIALLFWNFHCVCFILQYLAGVAMAYPGFKIKKENQICFRVPF